MNTRKKLASMALAAALLGIAGCAATSAQNPNGNYRPVNATPAESGPALFLKGHDVVAYHTENTHAMGSAEFRSTYEGSTFQFKSAQHKALFDANPQKYLPAYGGYCANGIVYGIPWGGDANTWKMIDGKVYIFGGQGSKDGFLIDEKANLALAEKYWNEEVKGGNSFWQRSKRLVFRVPHYKGGAELAALVEQARKEGKLK
jgi:YHS domain-containing protein